MDTEGNKKSENFKAVFQVYHPALLFPDSPIPATRDVCVLQEDLIRMSQDRDSRTLFM